MKKVRELKLRGGWKVRIFYNTYTKKWDASAERWCLRFSIAGGFTLWEKWPYTVNSSDPKKMPGLVRRFISEVRNPHLKKLRYQIQGKNARGWGKSPLEDFMFNAMNRAPAAKEMQGWAKHWKNFGIDYGKAEVAWCVMHANSVIHSSAGLRPGDIVHISGASAKEFNGKFIVDKAP